MNIPTIDGVLMTARVHWCDRIPGSTWRAARRVAGRAAIRQAVARPLFDGAERSLLGNVLSYLWLALCHRASTWARVRGNRSVRDECGVGRAGSIASAACGKRCSLAVAHQALRRHLPNLRLDQLRRSAAPGLLQIDTPEGVAYATADGRYLINGDLIDTATRENLTERRRRQQRRTSLATLEAGSTIDFDPEKSRHAIVVFTDVDCGYCRKFHQQVGELNRHGITVRYAAFPRTGPSGATWRKMQAVWCAADRQKALSRAKRGEPVSRPENCAAPSVGAQYALGTRLGLKGTPLIVLEDGRIINGYLSTEKLLGLLETASIGSAR